MATQPPQDGLPEQLEVQDEVVLATVVQVVPEQAAWVPLAVLEQKALFVPAFWQVSLVQELLSLQSESEEQGN